MQTDCLSVPDSGLASVAPNLSSSRATASDPGFSDQSFSTMPKSKTKSSSGGKSLPQQPEMEQTNYMPGMKEKKKKGLFSIFSRKKGAKFNVVGLRATNNVCGHQIKYFRMKS